jgi:hypothetical protein
MKVGVLATMMAFLLVGGLSLSAQAGPAPDSDSDGTIDAQDFCSTNATAPSPCGLDADNDGYGNACDGDFNNDGVVNFVDITPFQTDFQAGTDSGIGTDMNCDGVVNFVDITPFSAQFQQGTPGPSGLSCAGTVPCP